jgi:hypothetical protein
VGSLRAKAEKILRKREKPQKPVVRKRTKKDILDEMRTL